MSHIAKEKAREPNLTKFQKLRQVVELYQSYSYLTLKATYFEVELSVYERKMVRAALVLHRKRRKQALEKHQPPNPTTPHV